MQKFQAYTRSKAPSLLNAGDVKAFLTYLAVEKKVSASSQNIAFNSLLFFFRHVLGKEFGMIDGVVRAKQRSYITVHDGKGKKDRTVPIPKVLYDELNGQIEKVHKFRTPDIWDFVMQHKLS